MQRTLRIIFLLVACLMLVQSCGEDAYYDIVVVNDAWIFGTCSIYLDDELQFTRDVEGSETIKQVREGKHTIIARNVLGTRVAKQTFNVSQDQQWFVADHFDLDWMFD